MQERRTTKQAAAINEVILPAIREDGDNYSIHVWKSGHNLPESGTRFVIQYHGDDATDIECIWWIAPSGQYTWNQPSYKGRPLYPWAH